MTDPQKQAIYKFIVQQIKATNNTLLNPQSVLFYYIDNAAQIDPDQLIADQSQALITALQNQIASAQTQLSALQKTLPPPKVPATP